MSWDVFLAESRVCPGRPWMKYACGLRPCFLAIRAALNESSGVDGRPRAEECGSSPVSQPMCTSVEGRFLATMLAASSSKSEGLTFSIEIRARPSAAALQVDRRSPIFA